MHDEHDEEKGAGVTSTDAHQETKRQSTASVHFPNRSRPGDNTADGVDQLDLFDQPDAEDDEHQLTTAQKFDRYHETCPEVYDLVVKFTRQWINRNGRRKVGIDSIIGRVRWEVDVVTPDLDFKINNDYFPFYARLVMLQEPDLADVFEVRRSVADQWLNQRAA